MKPLRITWTFKTPVMQGDLPLHLDALLAFARVNESLTTGEDPAVAHDDLPLERCDQVWAASQVAFAPALARGRQQMVRRLDADRLAEAKGRCAKMSVNVFTPASGRFKAFNLIADYAWVPQANAWCVGDEDRVRALLETIPALGRLTRNGWGEIKQLDVRPAPAGEEGYWRLRALPLHSGLELAGTPYATVIQGVVPPYWDRTRHIPAAVPIEIPPH